jgi:hypothetical protein
MKNILLKRTNSHGITFAHKLLVNILKNVFDKDEVIGVYIQACPREDLHVKATQLLSVLPSSKPTCQYKEKGNVVRVLDDIWKTVQKKHSHPC